jgi:NitT/TauT family transport system substrate-binding protein
VHSSKPSRRFTLPFVCLALASWVLVPSTSSSASTTQALIPITIGYSPEGPFTGDNTIAVANYLGLWQKAGLKLEPAPFSVAPVVEVTALESNHVDLIFGGPGSVHLAMLGDARILGADDFSEEDFVIGTSKIHTISQLKGQSVIFNSGTTGEIILDLALHSVGLSLNDIKGIDIADTGSMIAAFLSGDAPAVATYVPISTTVLQKDPTAHVLFSDKSSYPKYVLPDPILTSEGYAAHHADALARFMWVYDKAQEWSIAHLAQTIQLIAALNKEPTSDVTVGAPPDNDRVIEPAQLNTAYGSALGHTWFESLQSVFEQMGVLTPSEVVSPSNYLDFAPALAAAKQMSSPGYAG